MKWSNRKISDAQNVIEKTLTVNFYIDTNPEMTKLKEVIKPSLSCPVFNPEKLSKRKRPQAFSD